MGYSYHDPRDDLYRRPSVVTSSPVNHTRRTWSNNGVHYAVETTSYSSPGISFGTTTGTAGSPLQNFFGLTQSTARNQGIGLLGTAFGLLGDVISAQQRQATIHEHPRRSTRQPYVEDLAYGADGDGDIENHPRSFISKFAERLLNNSQRSRRVPDGREHSPVLRRTARTGDGRKPRSYRTEERQPSWASDRAARVEENTDSDDSGDDSEEFDLLHARQPRRAFTANNVALIKTLENAAEHHRREARSYRKRLEQASRLPTANIVMLQGLLNELKVHETAYESAIESLNTVKAHVSNGGAQERAPRYSRPSQRREPSRTPQDDFSGVFPSNNFDTSFQARRGTHPIFTDLNDFEPLHPFAETPFGGISRALQRL